MVSGPVCDHPAHPRQHTSQLPTWLLGIVAANRIARDSVRGDAATVASLLGGLSHTDPCLRLSSAKTLAVSSNFGDQQVLDALLNLQSGSSRSMGVDDDDAEVRVCSVEAVGKLAAGTANPDACGKLLAKFLDEDWAVRQASIVALSRIIKTDDNGVLEQLLAMMRQEKWWAKVVAAEAVGQIASRGNAHVVEHLTGILKDEDWAVRKSACIALAKVARFGDIRIVQALLELLEDADWRVRKAAIEAIGDLADLGCEPAIHGLISRLEDKHVGERRLFDTPSPEDCDVKSTAVRSLLRVARPGDQAVLAALRRLCLRDPAASQFAQEAITGLSQTSS